MYVCMYVCVCVCVCMYVQLLPLCLLGDNHKLFKFP